jgi:uncharacterized protein YbaR (Trm112 family)
MNPAVLSLLRCPVTHQSLRLVTAGEAGQMGLGPQPVLLREDGRMYYTFEDHGFPLLLPGSGVAVPGDAVRPHATGALAEEC